VPASRSTLGEEAGVRRADDPGWDPARFDIVDA